MKSEKNNPLDQKLKISVITASYNYARYIEEAINSVITQTYDNWELIIVDDGSTDNSVEIIKKFCQKDNRIKFFQHKNGQNKGLKDTLLLGLENATGDWIAFLESDDVFKPDNLSKKVEVIKKNPELNFIFNSAEFSGKENLPKYKIKEFEKTQEKLSKMNFPKNMFFDFMQRNTIFTFSCVTLNAETLKSADFKSPCDVFLDWWLWVHISYKNDFYYIDQELTQWRIHPESYIKKAKKPFLFQLDIYGDIYKKNKKDLKILVFIFKSAPKLIFEKIKTFILTILQGK